METRIRRSYNKWSQKALGVVECFIYQNNDDIQQLQDILKLVEGFERTHSTICWQVSKQMISMNLDPKYTTKNIRC